MKFPLPRLFFSLFIFPTILFVGGGISFYRACWELSNRGNYLSINAHSGDVVAIFITPFIFAAACLLLYRCFFLEYSFSVFGESFTKSIQVFSGQLFRISSLRGLSGKMLKVQLRCNFPNKPIQKMHSFRCYDQSSSPFVRYKIQLFGISGNQQIQIAECKLTQKIGTIGGISAQENDNDKRSIEFPVNQSFSDYQLQIVPEVENNKTLEMNNKESSTKLEIRVKLSVCIKATSLTTYKNFSICEAKIQT